MRLAHRKADAVAEFGVFRQPEARGARDALRPCHHLLSVAACAYQAEYVRMHLRCPCQLLRRGRTRSFSQQGPPADTALSRVGRGDFDRERVTCLRRVSRRGRECPGQRRAGGAQHLHEFAVHDVRAHSTRRQCSARNQVRYRPLPRSECRARVRERFARNHRAAPKARLRATVLHRRKVVGPELAIDIDIRHGPELCADVGMDGLEHLCATHHTHPGHRRRTRIGEQFGAQAAGMVGALVMVGDRRAPHAHQVRGVMQSEGENDIPAPWHDHQCVHRVHVEIGEIAHRARRENVVGVGDQHVERTGIHHLAPQRVDSRTEDPLFHHGLRRREPQSAVR